MAEIKKILFAFELADISTEVAAWAELMGLRFDAEIHLLHVIPDLEYFHTPYAAPPQRFNDEEELRSKAHSLVSQFCAGQMKAPVTIAIRVGRPVETILDYIRTQGISLVLAGTHGRTGLDRMIFGSVTDRLLRLSPVPVLCIGPQHQPRQGGEP